MKIRKLLSLSAVLLLSFMLSVSCHTGTDRVNEPTLTNYPAIVIGYSNWAGWWPWAIAESEGLFAANGINVELRWFDDYTASMEALANGRLDGNCQTLNDTISFANTAINGAVVVLVNDNSAGNDKIIVAPGINTVKDLKGKTVALEEGVVNDFLLSLALEKYGLSRNDVIIRGMNTGDAAAAFSLGEVDAVGAFPPFWSIALEREGSKELISSQEFPGAIPDLLVVTQKLIDEQPEQVQGLVNTWFDILNFIENNPQRADQIMAQRANVSVQDLQKFKTGTNLFTIEDNLVAFSPGNTMKSMPLAAAKMVEFMVKVGFLAEENIPDLNKMFNDSFIQKYATQQ